MRKFLDENVGIAMKRLYKAEESLYYRKTDSYFEFEQTVFTKYMVWYSIPKDEHSYYLATCWPNLEEVFSSVKNGDFDISIILDTWPSMRRLLQNGITKNYSDCALIRISDFDDNSPTWLLLLIVENQNNNDLESIFDSKSIELIKKIQNESALLLYEIVNNEPKLKLKDIGDILKMALTYYVDTSVKEIVSDFLGNYIDLNLIKKPKNEMSFTNEIVNKLLDEFTDLIFKNKPCDYKLNKLNKL
ncbi:hypothetical protein BIU88_10390 [Chlorobaculum limnaeum]|uniref:Uncharacterized protein n=1 Tax=Chlorobaculum limnaeum TaxID=274537 RepID=A0A1D8D3X0_CHLLM|nr:hypothetical protein [Chlorobaculum limnaeum]AOS84505.1 hypothetical protein BIU88_10390 [Chlorobaculum limnaeum]